MEKKSCKNFHIAEISLNIESIEFQEMTKGQRWHYYRYVITNSRYQYYENQILSSPAYILPFTIVADDTGNTYKGEFVKFESRYLLCTMFNVNSLKIESNDKIEFMYKYKRSGDECLKIESNDKIEDGCMYKHRYDSEECMLDTVQT